MTLDVLDDVLIHHFSLKALERALQAFAIIYMNFSQRHSPRIRTLQGNSFPHAAPATASLAAGLHQIGMNAMEQSYTELLNEYRIALGLWSEVRAHYSPDKVEVAAATSHLEAIEQELASFSRPALAA